MFYAYRLPGCLGSAFRKGNFAPTRVKEDISEDPRTGDGTLSHNYAQDSRMGYFKHKKSEQRAVN